MREGIVQRFGRANQSIGRFLIACMVIGFASLIVAGIAAVWSTGRNQQHIKAVNHTYEVELAIARANILVEQAETTRRGYIISRQPIYLDSYRTMVAQVPAALRRIDLLTADNPREQANLARLRTLIADIEGRRDITNALVAAGQVDEAIRAFTEETTARRMRGIRDLGRAMEVEEQKLLETRDAEQRASVRAFYTTISIAGVLVLFVAVASLLTVLRYTRDLATSRDTLRDFADSLEELVTERTGDLTRANEEIQRFAYIVSHDLRAPLVNVMGFTAELDTAAVAITDLIDQAEQVAPDIVTSKARMAARIDLPEAIGFIRTSTEKMDRLINAILKLSREGRRVIAAEPLDMTALVRSIGDALQHLIEDQGARLEIHGTLPDIVSDRLALEQIFSNLIENAVKYLQPGRPGLIEVSGSRRGTRLTYEVSDNGRGIAPADHQRVFDLFRRSGNQDQAGEGIGLAHVRALAYRLGGVIDVHSELGKGAVFRLSLPAMLTDVQGN
ncbi:MAG: histidine kinase [Sphingomonas bacterium]|uniref:sensor histidine kinase n=1 Tax=Sphingomonas bacterium TaxID=1895847 RepID=UPI0026055DF6|nr:sensor histidine kinase [Sphingomonas bacterium]MDB5705213.1 histidine kinase [Sphingomonas bacterium]